MINNDTFIQTSHKENLSSNRQKNMIMLTEEEASKYPELLKKCNKEDDKASEINQIEYEQRLITERMIRIEFQKKRLQDLLSALQTMESGDDDDDDDDSDDNDQNT